MDGSIWWGRDLDKAFQRASGRWLRVTKETRVQSTSTLTVGSATVPAFPTGFLPELLIDAYLTLPGYLISPEITITTIEAVLQAQRSQWPWLWPDGYYPLTYPPTSPPTGQPRLIGCSSTTAAITDYLPDQPYVLNYWWWQKLTAFTPGCMGAWSSATEYYPGDVVSSGGNIYQALNTNTNVAVGTPATWTNLGAGTVQDPTTLTVNIPDESIDAITMWGIPAYLQMTQPEKAAQAAALLVQFDAEAKKVAARDAGGLGPQVLYKQNPHNYVGDWSRGRGAW